MESHSPLPWRLEHKHFPEFVDVWLVDSAGQELATFYVSDGLDEPTSVPAEANADLIVRAVNSHAELLAALDDAAERFAAMCSMLNCGNSTASVVAFAAASLERMHAAIAKAEGVTHVNE